MLHTHGVTGSKPVPRTILRNAPEFRIPGRFSRVYNSRLLFLMNNFIKTIEFIIKYENLFLLLIAALILLIFISNKKLINKHAVEEIERFIHTGKYIRHLYVEKDQSLDFMRFCIYGKKWKNLIVDYYNLILKDNPVYIEYLFKEFHLLPVINSKNTLEEIYNTLKNIQDRLKKYSEKNFKDISIPYRDSTYIIEYNNFRNKISNLIKSIKCIESKSVLFIGSAGNGKSMLISHAAELAIKCKKCVIFLDSKTVKNSLIEHVNNCIPLKTWFPLLKDINKRFFILDKILGIKNNQLFIFIDALNENDDISFKNNLVEFIKKINKYKNFKIIMTCRSEYFEERFEKYLNHLIGKEIYIHILEEPKKWEPYKPAIQRRIFDIYSRHYNFSGQISLYIKESLLQSLFLMRMFFEVNENGNNNILTLNRFEIYNRYIEKIKNNYKKNDSYFEIILSKITNYMIDNCRYEFVPIKDLNLNEIQLEYIKDIADNNILLSTSLKKNEGRITSYSEEVVSIVFQSMRDYLIAKELISRYEKNEDSLILISFFHKTKKNYRNNYKLESPLEGVFHYVYSYFKNKNDIKSSNFIIRHIYKIMERYTESKDFFHDFRVTWMLEHEKPLSNYEKNIFITYFIDSKYGRIKYIFYYFLLNSICGHRRDLKILINVVKDINDINTIKNICSEIFSLEYNFSMRNQEAQISNIKRTIRDQDLLCNKHYLAFILISIAVNSGIPHPRHCNIALSDVNKKKILKELINSVKSLKLKEKLIKLRDTKDRKNVFDTYNENKKINLRHDSTSNIFLFKKVPSFEKINDSLRLIPNSYAYNFANRIYNYYFGKRISVKYLHKYYKPEFSCLYDFLYNHYILSSEVSKKYDDKDSYLNFNISDNLDSAIYNYITYGEKNPILEVTGGFNYEN